VFVEPLETEVVVIARGKAAIVRLNDFVEVSLAASVTFAVKANVPAAVGVPEIAPDDVFMERPGGKEPLVMLHEYGVVPPVACNIAEYAVPTVPLAKLEVEIDSVCFAAAIAIFSDCDAVLLLASFTCTVKLEVPAAVGVPEMAPDEAFRLNPAGSDPLLRLHI